jgi:hypothetical protein
MATPVTPLASPSRRVYVLLFTHVFTQRLVVEGEVDRACE